MMADLEGDRETRVRFEREARVAGELLHRNVINVYEMGEEDGRLYMVMELLEGETLGDYLKRVGKLPLERGLDLMMQVCEGLAVAHAHAIVHRDVKPGNLFVLRDGGLEDPRLRRRAAREFQHDRAAGSSSARRISCRPSRRAARRSISGPTCSRRARCSTTCCPAASRSPPTIFPR